MKKIAIVGSINTDFIFLCNKIPNPSETVTGKDFKTSFGGKGANEAVAVARLGGKSMLFAKLGDDVYSKENYKNLLKEKVNIESIEVCKNKTGGCASISLDNQTNSIIVIPGTNALVDRKYITNHETKLLENDIFGIQLEIPVETVEYTIKLLKRNNKIIVFNPSPISNVKSEMFDLVDYIIVNEVELCSLPNYKNLNQIFNVYKEKLILTKGSEGVYFYELGEIKNIPAIKTEIVDTTGAGDTFLASFMVGLSKDYPLKKAIHFANICAGLKITKLGAQSGMPKIADVKKYIQLKNIKIEL